MQPAQVLLFGNVLITCTVQVIKHSAGAGKALKQHCAPTLYFMIYLLVILLQLNANSKTLDILRVI